MLGNKTADKINSVGKTKFKTSILRSGLVDFSDAYIFVKGTITLAEDANRNFIDVRNRFLAFKNNAPFTNFISKINNVLIGNAEDLDILMSMCNLLECSKIYKKTTGSLWNYNRDEPNDFQANNYNANPIANFGSFKYKSSILGTVSNANQENGENTENEHTKTKEKFKLLFH